MNRTKTAFLLACLTFLLIALEHIFVGRTGVVVAFLLAAATCFSIHSRSPEMVRRFVPVTASDSAHPHDALMEIELHPE
ncbi:MAG: hypothetical protein EHM38_07175 [Geobacteraceae bacterium]|nr:MAG: hypothetical protein EHM38_07175 [Geobacteraceae bacterium]